MDITKEKEDTITEQSADTNPEAKVEGGNQENFKLVIEEELSDESSEGTILFEDEIAGGVEEVERQIPQIIAAYNSAENPGDISLVLEKAAEIMVEKVYRPVEAIIAFDYSTYKTEFDSLMNAYNTEVKGLVAEYDEAKVSLDDSFAGLIKKAIKERARQTEQINRDLTDLLESNTIADAEQSRNDAIQTARENRTDNLETADRKRNTAVETADRKRNTAVETADRKRNTAVETADRKRNTDIKLLGEEKTRTETELKRMNVQATGNPYTEPLFHVPLPAEFADNADTSSPNIVVPQVEESKSSISLDQVVVGILLVGEAALGYIGFREQTSPGFAIALSFAFMALVIIASYFSAEALGIWMPWRKAQKALRSYKASANADQNATTYTIAATTALVGFGLFFFMAFGNVAINAYRIYEALRDPRPSAWAKVAGMLLLSGLVFAWWFIKLNKTRTLPEKVEELWSEAKLSALIAAAKLLKAKKEADAIFEQEKEAAETTLTLEKEAAETTLTLEKEAAETTFTSEKETANTALENAKTNYQTKIDDLRNALKPEAGGDIYQSAKTDYENSLTEIQKPVRDSENRIKEAWETANGTLSQLEVVRETVIEQFAILVVEKVAPELVAIHASDFADEGLDLGNQDTLALIIRSLMTDSPAIIECRASLAQIELPREALAPSIEMEKVIEEVEQQLNREQELSEVAEEISAPQPATRVNIKYSTRRRLRRPRQSLNSNGGK